MAQRAESGEGSSRAEAQWRGGGKAVGGEQGAWGGEEKAADRRLQSSDEIEIQIENRFIREQGKASGLRLQASGVSDFNALNEGEARLNAFNGKAASGSREHGAWRIEQGAWGMGRGGERL